MLKRVTNSFIDLKKAFDTVWHDGLFLKLQLAGIRGKNIPSYKICVSPFTS